MTRDLTAAVLLLTLASCGGGTPATPTRPVPATPTTSPSSSPPPSAAATPAPTTSPDRAFELRGEPGACIVVTYTGQASWAQVQTHYTLLDSPTEYGHLLHDVAAGASITRCVGKPCTQVDAEQVGVKPIGGAFFDKAMQPVSAEAASASCKPGPTPTPTPSPTPTPCSPSGKVTVYADTHVSGSYYYEVRLASGAVVWSGTLARGSSATFSYPPNGDRLYLWLDTDPGPGRKWEHDSLPLKAECSSPKGWNEHLGYLAFDCDCQ